MSFLPPRSPYGLIQEDLWPDEWKILIACVFLNCTSRKQSEKILPTFFRKWPKAETIVTADPYEIEQLVAPLGFKKMRTKRVIELSRAYLGAWKHATELPGVGTYAARAWEIFCKNQLGTEAPKDGALTRYWNWRLHDQKKIVR
jgi:methyl-CpG-binding domain protein 4